MLGCFECPHFKPQQIGEAARRTPRPSGDMSPNGSINVGWLSDAIEHGFTPEEQRRLEDAPMPPARLAEL
jgi:hypothetical protein